MMCKKNLALLGALLALGALAHSTEFSIQVSQCDRGNGKISDSARLFEDALMEYFFEAGHVVSNFPVTLAAGPEEDSVAQALSDARRGSLDYLASVVLVYDRALQGAGGPFVSADWKLYQVSDGRVCSSGTVRLEDYAQGNSRRDSKAASLAAMKKCALALSSEMDRVLRGGD